MGAIIGVLNAGERAVSEMQKAAQSYFPRNKNIRIKYYSGEKISIAVIPHLKLAKEPPVYENGEYVVVLDGEIYNVNDEIQGEQILRLWKRNSLKEINGHFSATIYDKKSKTLHLITDRLGTRPLYLYEVNGVVIWSSSIKFFRFFEKFTSRFNRSAITNFIKDGNIDNCETWYEHVKIA